MRKMIGDYWSELKKNFSRYSPSVNSISIRNFITHQRLIMISSYFFFTASAWALIFYVLIFWQQGAERPSDITARMFGYTDIVVEFLKSSHCVLSIDKLCNHNLTDYESTILKWYDFECSKNFTKFLNRIFK